MCKEPLTYEERAYEVIFAVTGTKVKQRRLPVFNKPILTIKQEGANMKMRIEGILDIRIPSSEEIKNMNLEQLKELKTTLEPYYDSRSEILEKYGIEQWEKVMLWKYFCMKLQK